MPYQFVLPRIVPSDRFPIVALLVCMFITFNCIDFVLLMVELMAKVLGFSKVFIGLVLIAWGSNINDLMSLCVANKNGELPLGMSSVFSS
jgi:Ca2+/Na+ antiporter